MRFVPVIGRVFAASLACAAVVTSTASSASAQRGGGRGGQRPAAMVLTIAAWPDGDPIPLKYTQAGEQVSPPLSWTNVPAGTQSFVVNMIDPDVAVQRGPEGQPHWIVWNIPATSTGLPENVPQGAQLPDGTQQISASGPGYRGPGAPATGPMHHYTFEVYALDTKLDVAPSAAPQAITAALETRASVMKALQGHVLGKAVYVGLFRRPQ